MNPYVFGKGEEEEIYHGRADDLMQRNLDRRVKRLFPCARRDARTKSGGSSSSSSPTPSTLVS
jgi:polyphosphate kinase